VIVTGLIFFRQKCAAQHGLDAQHVKQPQRSHYGKQRLWMIAAAEVDHPGSYRRHFFE
jgi:hypothetical protein